MFRVMVQFLLTIDTVTHGKEVQMSIKTLDGSFVMSFLYEVRMLIYAHIIQQINEL